MNAQLSVSSAFVSQDQTVDPQLAQKQKTHPPFRKVTDSRGNPIKGLWQRNGRFYAQLRIRGKRNAVKVPLVDSVGVPLRTVAQARAALNDLLVKRRTHSLPILNRTPLLNEYIECYLTWLRRTQTKSPLTITKEAGALANWSKRFGFLRLAHLQRVHINEFIAWRKETNRVSNRTINLDVVALNNCLRHARDEGLIVSLPTQNWTPLVHQSPRRPLWTSGQIDMVCEAAIAKCTNGRLLADYIRFLACTGMRRNEALQIKWADVDWKNRRLTIRVTKFGAPRDLDLNATTETLLRELQLRATPNAQWLFPSPRAGDEAAKSLQVSLEVARNAAGLPDFCFHDLRHYFISTCVMAGIDYLTIARWVGHRDGGVLIGRIYGHLNDEHAKKQAAKLHPGPAPGAHATDPTILRELLQKTLAQLEQFENQKF